VHCPFHRVISGVVIEFKPLLPSRTICPSPPRPTTSFSPKTCYCVALVFSTTRETIFLSLGPGQIPIPFTVWDSYSPPSQLPAIVTGEFGFHSYDLPVSHHPSPPSSISPLMFSVHVAMERSAPFLPRLRPFRRSSSNRSFSTLLRQAYCSPLLPFGPLSCCLMYAYDGQVQQYVVGPPLLSSVTGDALSPLPRPHFPVCLQRKPPPPLRSFHPLALHPNPSENDPILNFFFYKCNFPCGFVPHPKISPVTTNPPFPFPPPVLLCGLFTFLLV